MAGFKNIALRPFFGRRVPVLMAGGAMITLLSAGGAFAQGTSVLSPQTDWAIAPIEGAYCTLSRRFNNNMVLTIARNPAQETSLAFDFQRELFDPARAYRIALRAARQTRDFDMRPVSSKAFVLRTGRDESLYDSMRATGRLDVTIDGRPYTLQIPDLSSGDSRLGGCVSSLSGTVPAPASSPTSSAVAPPADSGSPLLTETVTRQRQELENLQKMLQTLREENIRLSDALDHERHAAQDHMRRAGDQGGAVTALQERLATLMAENDSLRTGLARADDTLRTVKSQSESLSGGSAARIATLEQEINTLRRSGDILQQELDAVRADKSARMAQVQEDAARLQSENDTLRVQLRDIETRLSQTDSQSADRLAALQSENDRLRAERESLRGQSLSASEEARTLGARFSRLESENATLRQDLARLEDQVASESALGDAAEERVNALIAENNRLRDEIRTADTGSNADMDALRAEIAAMREENGSLRHDVALARNAASSSEERGREIAALQAQTDHLRSERDRARADYQTALETQGQAVESLHAELAALRTENTSLREESARLSVLATQKSENDQDAAQEIAVLKTEKAKLAEDLAHAARARQDMESSLNAEIAQLRTRHESLQAERDAARLDLASSQGVEAEFSALQTENARLQQETVAMVARLAESDGRVRMLETLSAEERTTLQTQNAALQEQIATLRGARESSGQAEEILSRELAALRTAHQTAQGDLMAARRALAESRQREHAVENLTADNRRLRGELETLRLALADAQGAGQNLAILQQENSELRRSLETTLSETHAKQGEQEIHIQTLQAENRDLRAEISRLSTVNVAQETDSRDLLDKEILALREENQALMSQLAAIPSAAGDEASWRTPEPEPDPDTSEQTRRLESRLHDLETENTALRTAHDSETAAMRQLRGQIGALENTLRKMAEDNQTMGRELATLRTGHARSAQDQATGETDMDQAVRRYHEAEREIARLVSLVEQEKALRIQETARLESLLFDPVLTQRAQTERVDSLEREVQAARDALNAQKQLYETRIAQIQTESENPAPVAAVPSGSGDQTETGWRSAPAHPEPDAATVTLAATPEPTREPEPTPEPSVAPPPAHTRSRPIVMEPVRDTRFPSAEDLAAFLTDSGVRLTGSGVHRIENVSRPDFQAYRWDAAGLFGSAEVRLMQERPFTLLVDEYILRTRGRCNGSHAATPSYADDIGDMQMISYDIVCVQDSGGSSASLLFYGKGGVFSAISHETGLEDMERAMDGRDKLFSSLAATRTASR